MAYLKHIYHFASEHQLLDKTSEEIDGLDLPFKYKYIPLDFPNFYLEMVQRVFNPGLFTEREISNEDTEKTKDTMSEEKSKLAKLYDLRRLSQEFGMEWTEAQEAQLVKEEERIIREEVVPLVKDSIEPALAQVQRELVLVVDYVPSQPLKVSLSRKRNLFDAITDAVEIAPDPKVEHRDLGTQQNPAIKRGPRTRLRVTMPDGEVIAEPQAADTFQRVIMLIGPDRVRPLDIRRFNIPLISNTKDDKYNQRTIGKGWYLLTHSSTEDKRRQLEEIADRLDIPMTVEIIP